MDTLLRSCGLHTLGEDPSVEAIGAALSRLAGRYREEPNQVRKELLREGAIKYLKEAGIQSPARLVNAVIREMASEGDERGNQDRHLALSPPERWEAPVDGDQILTELVKIFAKYLSLPKG